MSINDIGRMISSSKKNKNNAKHGTRDNDISQTGSSYNSSNNDENNKMESLTIAVVGAQKQPKVQRPEAFTR